MKMQLTIVREDDYRNELRSYYNSILNGRLLNFDISSLNDDELLSSICNYNTSEKIVNNNFCTWVTIGDVGSSEYNGNYYEFIKLTSDDNAAFEINFSQFRYPMSPNKKSHIAFPSYDSTKADYVCSVDGQCITPELFFAKHKGEKLLLLYSFPAVTAFNKEKTCYLFAHKNVSISDLKKYILYAQYHTVKDIVEYPTLYIPGTTIKTEFLDMPNCRPMYNHFCRCDATDKFALSLFEEEFRKLFESILDKLNAYIK